MPGNDKTLVDIQAGDTDRLAKGLDNVAKSIEAIESVTERASKRKSYSEFLLGDSSSQSKALENIRGIRSGLRGASEELEVLNKTSLDFKNIEEYEQSARSVSDTLESVEKALQSVQANSGQFEEEIFDTDSMKEQRQIVTDLFSQIYNAQEAFASISDDDILWSATNREDIKKTAEELKRLEQLASQYTEELQLANNANAGSSKRFFSGLSQAGKRAGLGREDRVDFDVSFIADAAKEAEKALKPLSERLNEHNEFVDELGTTYSSVVAIAPEFLSSISQVPVVFAQNIDKYVDSFQTVQEQSEDLDNLGSSLKKFSDDLNVTAQNSQGATSLLQGSIGKGVGAISKGASVLSRALPVITGVFEGIKLGFNVMDRIAGTTQEQIEKRIDALEEEAQVTEELNRLIEQGSIATLEKQRKVIRENILAEQDRLNFLIDFAGENTGYFNKLRSALEFRITGNAQIYGAAGNLIEESSDKLEEMNEELGRLNNEGLEQAIEYTSELAEANEAAEDAARSLEKAENDLLDARADILQAESEFRDEMSNVDIDYFAETQRIREERYLEDENRLNEHLENLQDEQEDYNDNTEDLWREHLSGLENATTSFNEDMLSYEEEYNESVRDIRNSYAEEQRKAEQEYEESRLEKRERYQKTISELEQDFNEDRLQRQKDYQEELFLAELNNDALRFYELQREQEKANEEALDEHQKRLTEEEQQLEEELQQDREAFEERQAEARQQHRERLQEEKSAYEERKEQRRRQYEERKQTLKDEFQETLEEEERLYQERRNNMVENFQEEEALLEKQRAIEDRDRTLRLSERRRELRESFAEELRYFEMRERALTMYIKGLNDFQRDADMSSQALSDNVLNPEEVTPGMRQAIQEEIDAIGSTSDPELAKEQNALFRIFRNIDQGNSVTLTDEDALILEEAFEKGNARALADFYEVNENTRDFINDPESAGFRDMARGADTESEMSGMLISSLGEYLENLGLQDDSLLLDSEKKRIDANQEIIDAYDESTVSYSDAAKQVSETNTQIEEEAGRLSGNFEQQARQLQESQEDIYYSTEELAENAAVSSADTFARSTQRQTREQSEGLEEQEQNIEEGFSQQTDTQREYLSEQESNLQSSEENKLALEDEYYKQEAERIAEEHGIQYERLSEHEQQKLEMAIRFRESERRIINRHYEAIARTVESSNRSIARSITNYWSIIGRNTASVLEQIVSLSRRAAQSASSIERSERRATSTGSTNTASSTSQSQTASSSGGIIAAARGYYADSPTGLIAGEGRMPEVIMPLTESQGIPDEVLKSMGDSIAAYSEPLFRASTMPDSSRETNAFMIQQFDRMIEGMQGRSFNFGNIDIGSNVSRQEIVSQFESFADAIIEVLEESTRP